MKEYRMRAAALAAALLAASLGLAVGSGSAEALESYGSEPACYRTAHDVHYPEVEGENEFECRPFHQLVFLATGSANGNGNSLPACIKPDEAYFRPAFENCPSGFELIFVYTTTQGGIETCTQPDRSYHAPKDDGSCRPSRTLVELQLAFQGV